MILQQNYIKIIQYSQKAFKIYCKRALASAIIKTLQKRTNKQKQKTNDDQEISGNQNTTKIVSEKSLIYLQGMRQDSIDGQSVISEARKTQNNMEKYQNSHKSATVVQKFQIMYGDLVYLELLSGGKNSRAKHFLNRLKFCFLDQMGIGTSSDLRCVLQIVYPGTDLQQSKKGTPIYRTNLISFKSISNKQYLKVRNNKIAYSDDFGKQLQLSKQFNQCCVFQIDFDNQYLTNQTIVSGQNMIIKLFGEDLYMNVHDKQREVFFSQTPAVFKLKKLKKNINNFIPQYFKLDAKKFDTAILANPINMETISQKKTILNAVAINQSSIETKISPISFINFDFTKIPQQDPKLISNKYNYSHHELNCWQFIDNNGKSEYVKIFNPIIGLGLTLKSVKNIIKLTPNINDFTNFKIVKKDENTIFLNIENTSNELDIIFDRNCDRYIFTPSKSQPQSTSKMLRMKEISVKSSKMICQMIEILDILKRIYQFLNNWGNQIDDKSQTVYYSVKQIKLGSSIMMKKVKKIQLVFKILNNYLNNPQYSTTQIQNIVNSTKILQLLINICKIIIEKIGYRYPDLQADQQSPFWFAKNNLENVLKSTFTVILKLTKQSVQNSNTIISQVSFFNMILVAYPEQIGEILQEALKNLSLLSLKTETNPFHIWIKLIEPIKQDIIRVQKTYIDVVAEVVVDPNDQGIPQYQNKCKQLLFNNNTNKRKGIPKFGIDNETEKPIIIFESQTMMSQFLEKNKHLSKLNLVHLNSASYFIQGFFPDRYVPSLASSEVSEQYVGYIGSIIKMFRNLCRNRNKKLSKIVCDWGITEQHIQSVFNSQKISWQLRTNYLSLWSAIYIDEDPFLPFDKRQSKCHQWDKIGKYSLQDCTAIIFKQYTDENLASMKLNEFGDKIYPILSSFFHFFKKKLSENLKNLSYLRCLLTVLNTIYQMMNLGYMTLKAMKDYIGIILYLLSSLEQGMFGKKSNEQELIKFHHNIILKFIQILTLYEDIWVEIYGLEFLQLFYKRSQKKQYVWATREMEDIWENIIKNKFQETSEFVHHKNQSTRKRTRFNVFSQTQNSMLNGKAVDHLSFQIPLTFQQIDNEISDFLINLLTKRILEHRCESHQSLIFLLDKKIMKRERVCEYLQTIMILNNEKQQEIYRNFSGRQSNKLLNWLKIQQIVIKISQIEFNNSHDQAELRSKKQKILELNNILVKIIRQMNIYKSQNLISLKKCQSILQKLKVHTILMDLLKYSEKTAYKELMKTVFDFFCQFMADNQFNCQVLLPYVEKFTRNLNYEGLVYIIPTLISKSQDKTSTYKNVHELVFKMTPNHVNIYLLMIIDKLIGIDPLSESTQELRNILAKRILENFNIRAIFNEDLSIDDGYSRIKSFQLIKIMCKLSPDNPQLQKQIKKVYTKCSLQNKLKTIDSYSQKKLYLKLFIEVYLQDKQTENFEIEDYFKIIILKQIQKLPYLCMKLLNKNTLSPDKCIRINAIYQQLMTFNSQKVQTKNEEDYFEYILSQKDHNEISILTFSKIIISKWKGKSKSENLFKTKNYFRKLEHFLYLIFYQENTAYQRAIFQEIELINLGLNSITVESPQDFKYDRKFDNSCKEEVIKFYNTLSKIIVQQNISAHSLFSCFNINSQKLEMKRSNFNISDNISQIQFMKCLDKLKNKIQKQLQINALLTSVQLFRFININKDFKNKQIDVYFFMDKLISVMEYNKNMRIKLQISKNMSAYDEQQILDNIKISDFNIYPQNQCINEEQFNLQVQTFCQSSISYQNTIYHKMNSKIKQSALSLNDKIIDQWINDASMNIFMISQYYQLSILYTFVLAVLDKGYEETALEFEKNQRLVGCVLEYLSLLQTRFIDSKSANILNLYSEILIKFQNKLQVVEKLQKSIEKAYERITNLMENKKSQENIGLIKIFKNVFTRAVNFPNSTEYFKIQMKFRVTQTLKKTINQGIDLSSLHDFQIVEALLHMWSENQLTDEIQNNKLMQEIVFVEWIEEIFSKKSLKQISGGNSKNVNKTKFCMMLTKVIIKFMQNHDNFSILKKGIFKIEQAAIELFQQHVAPKKIMFAEEQYCLNKEQCSQFFCNAQKITSHDESILTLLLSLFIISKIYIAVNPSKLGKMQKSIAKIATEVKNMIGQIKYRAYGRDMSYNFKIPSCHVFNNKQIEVSIMQEMEKIPPHNIYMYLHSLSKVFYRELSLVSWLHQKFSPLTYIYTLKTKIRKVLILIYTLIVGIGINFQLISPNPTENVHSVNPFIIVFVILSAVLNTFWLCTQAYQFKSKCRYFYPQKNIINNGKLNYVYYTSKKKNFIQKQLTLKTMKTITKKQPQDATTNEPEIQDSKTFNEAKQKLNEEAKIPKNSYSFKQMIKQFQFGILCMHFLLIAAHFVSIVHDGRYIIVIIFFQILDLKSVRGYFLAIFQTCKKMGLLFVVGLIVLDFCFIFYSSQAQYSTTSLMELLKLFAYDIYYVFFLGNFNLTVINEELQISYTLMQIYFITCFILFIFQVSHQMYSLKKQEKYMDKKCLVCLKTEDEIKKKGNFKIHLANQHRLWDYLYFFIQFDNKSMIEGIGLQIQEQIKRQDYRFIKLY